MHAIVPLRDGKDIHFPGLAFLCTALMNKPKGPQVSAVLKQCKLIPS